MTTRDDQQEFIEAVAGVLPYLKLEGDRASGSWEDMRGRAQRLRDEADAIDARAQAIMRLRRSLEAVTGERREYYA